jgi:NAD(P)-dependent dehydrogenase (short-subunit alcohol dehydrogenase family)
VPFFVENLMSQPSQRTVLITGCSTGIGYCCAKGLQQRGYRVFASARRTQDVERLRDEGLQALQLDLDDSQSIADAVDLVLERTGGRLYALFNNAGFGQAGAIEDLSRQALREQFETNFFGLVELQNRIIPVMRVQGEGRIIQDSSVLGFVAMPYRGAYVASKYALEGMTDALRLELAGTGIYPTLIEPGPILTRFRANSLAAFRRHVDIAGSPHRERYEAMLARLAKEGEAVPFTLPPEAVLKKLIRALEARRPKARYYVTFPTYLFAGLKRVLSDRALDRIVAKV